MGDPGMLGFEGLMIFFPQKIIQNIYSISLYDSLMEKL